MSLTQDRSCGCGPLSHPPIPVIPAGLATLEDRQLAGFPEYRAAMLTAIPSHTDLAGWRARSEADLGVMLLEAWSVVLDTTGFYDARIAERSYLSTAPDAAAARRLTALIGHRPRPAIAARVDLAVEADGNDPVTLPRGTGFRSGAFEAEPPQVFELATDHKIWPRRNCWQLAPVRDAAFDGTLRFLPRRAPSAGAVLAIWNGTHSAAVRVASVDADPAPDGITYQKATLDLESAPGLAALIDQPRADLHVAIMRIPMPQFMAASVDIVTRVGGTRVEILAVKAVISPSVGVVVLDTIYSQVKPGQRAVVEVGGTLHPVTITSVGRVMQDIPDSGTPLAKQALTKVGFSPSLQWDNNQGFTLHASPFNLGAPSRIAKTQISLNDIKDDGKLRAPVDLGNAPGGGPVIARGTGAEGAELGGTIVEDGNGQAHFATNGGNTSFDPLATPVKLYGNIVEAVRGESIYDEELGSGNAALAYQSFTLKKSPLAWVEDASLTEGRRPELSVRVNGIEWARVDTLFGRKPDEQIYTVSLEPDGGSRITFGNGKRGARLSSGVGNIRADYRFGAGSAKPPAGSIKSIAKPFKGLLGVIGPLPATGGADAETADELRDTAPANALTLGRAVSLQDFEAMARGYAGVSNAAAAWAWDTRRQRASAKLWIITDGGDPSADLALFLSARAAPDLTVAVELAGIAVASNLSITLDYTAGHDPVVVRDALTTTLFDDKTGLLSPRNQIIGGALFRSALTHRLHQVAGVAGVPTLLLDGVAMAHGIAPGQGNWFNLQPSITVS